MEEEDRRVCAPSSAPPAPSGTNILSEFRLSKQEQQVLMQSMSGLGDKEVADVLLPEEGSWRPADPARSFRSILGGGPGPEKQIEWRARSAPDREVTVVVGREAS
jgi:hypothetical protein